MVYGSFTQWVEAEILPSHQAHPTWHRLDGWNTGGNREIVGRFSYGGKTWVVHGDTRFNPVLVAYRAICERGTSDPFNVEQAKVSYSLTLKPDLWKTDLPKHFYVYSQTP